MIRIRRIRIQIAHYSFPGVKRSTESTRALESHPGNNLISTGRTPHRPGWTCSHNPSPRSADNWQSPCAAERRREVRTLGLEPTHEPLIQTSSIGNDQQHDGEDAQGDTRNGHALVGGTPLIRRLHPQKTHNDSGNSGNSRENVSGAENTRQRTGWPASRRAFLASGMVVTP